MALDLLITPLVLTRKVTVEFPLNALGSETWIHPTFFRAEKSQLFGAVTFTLKYPPFRGTWIELVDNENVQTV